MSEDVLCYTLEEAGTKISNLIGLFPAINIRLRKIGAYFLLTFWTTDSEAIT
jgi:hypothetical protein